MEEHSHLLKTEVELIKKDIQQLNVVIGKLDSAIEKISEVASSINRMLAVQETKLHNAEKSLGDNVEIIHERISQHRDEVTVEIEKSHRVIMDEIRKLREDQQHHHQLMSERLNRLEQWRWFVVGAATALGVALANLPWGNLFK